MEPFKSVRFINLKTPLNYEREREREREREILLLLKLLGKKWPSIIWVSDIPSFYLFLKFFFSGVLDVKFPQLTLGVKKIKKSKLINSLFHSLLIS